MTETLEIFVFEEIKVTDIVQEVFRLAKAVVNWVAAWISPQVEEKAVEEDENRGPPETLSVDVHEEVKVGEALG